MTAVFGVTDPQEYRHRTKHVKTVSVRVDGRPVLLAIMACSCGLVFADSVDEQTMDDVCIADCPRCDPELAMIHNRWARPDWSVAPW